MPFSEGAPAHGSPRNLLPSHFKTTVTSWLQEDTPTFDYGGFVVGADPATARLLAKSPGILAGVPFFDEVFAQLDCQVQWHFSEGDELPPRLPAHIATVTGEVRNVLLGERVALNMLARCSGIATQTRRMLQLLRDAGYTRTLAGTRKTTPGFRLVEKYGVLVGGADGHRMDLSSMVMLKDNHIWACSAASRRRRASKAHDGTSGEKGSEQTPERRHPVPVGSPEQAPIGEGIEGIDGVGQISSTRPTEDHHAASPSHNAASDATAGSIQPAPNAAAIQSAVAAARSAAGFSVKVEVECQSEAEAEAAIRGGADVVMLDNFTPSELRLAARSLKRRLGDGQGYRFLLEVSGGLTEDNVVSFVEGCKDDQGIDVVDVVSSSAIHQGVKHVDFSLKVIQE